MLVKEIIEKMLVRLDKVGDYDLDAEIIDTEIYTMVKCVNMAIAEIATDYLPVRCLETVEPINGIIALDSLKNRLIKVVNIKVGDSEIKWKIYPEFIKVDSVNKCVIDYCFLPNQAELNGKVCLPAQVTSDLISYGALAEYCLINGRYEDSMIYDRRYKDSLREACRIKKEIRIKARVW